MASLVKSSSRTAPSSPIRVTDMGTLVAWRRELFRKLVPFSKLGPEDQLFWKDTFRLYRREVNRIKKQVLYHKRSLRLSLKKSHGRGTVASPAFKAHIARGEKLYEEQRGKMEDLRIYLHT